MGERLSLSDRCSPLFASRAEGKLIHGRRHLNTGRGGYRARADHHGPQTHECCIFVLVLVFQCSEDRP